MDVILSIVKCIIFSLGFLWILSVCVNSQTTQSDDVTTSSDYTPCPAGQTLCGNGTGCYPINFKCDGIVDCSDGSDELNCPTLPPSCPEQQKRCPDGSCINPNNDCPVLFVNTTTFVQQSSTDSVTPASSSHQPDSSGDSVHLSSTIPVIPASSSHQPDSSSVHLSSTDPITSASSSHQTDSFSSSLHLSSTDHQADITPSPQVTTSSSDIELPMSFPSSQFSISKTAVYSKQTVSTSSVPADMETNTSIAISPSTQAQMTSSLNVQSSTEFLSTYLTTSSPFFSYPNSSISVTSVNHTSRDRVSSVVTNQTFSTVISSDDVRYSTHIQQTSSDVSFSKIIPSTSTITQSSSFVSSSFDTTEDFTSVTSSSKSSSFIYTTKMMTSSTETPSLTLQPTGTTSILQSTSDIRPSKTVSVIYTSSILISDAVTSPVNRSSTVAPPTDEPLLPWVIALIVCGSVIFLYLVYLLYVLCTKRHKLTKYKMDYNEDPDDIGYRRSIVKRPGHDYASFDNKIYYEQPDTPDSEIDNPFTIRNLRNSDFRNVNE